ncbi:MAG: alpha/beta hydrolase [Thermoanaerobaculia bacterium]
MSDTVSIPATHDAAELIARVVEPQSGSAPVVLYLHGFGSSQDGEKAEFFRDRASRAGFGFVSLDFQGHGRSGGDMRGLTLTRCLEDVIRVRHAVPSATGPVCVFGSSMGALVALWHAAIAGSRDPVRALALISPAIGMDASLREMLGTDGMERWQLQGILDFTNEEGTFALGWPLFTDLAGRPARDLAARHRAPTLIFQGKLDDRVSWRRVAEFAVAASSSSPPAHPLIRLELLEDGDHRLIDRLDWIWAETRDFFGRATRQAQGT